MSLFINEAHFVIDKSFKQHQLQPQRINRTQIPFDRRINLSAMGKRSNSLIDQDDINKSLDQIKINIKVRSVRKYDTMFTKRRGIQLGL